MIKKITLFAALLTLSGCSTYYEMKNCDPEKNYRNINVNAIEDYKKIVSADGVRSYYSKIIPIQACENNECLTYDSNNYDFQERYFDDTTRKGIYTIKISTDINDKNCIKKQYSYDKNCYLVTKNKDNVIKSRFYLETNYTDNVFYKKFIDLNTNIILFESSYQIYHIPTILDNPSGDSCKINITPKNYDFDISKYPK